ncbi:MAG: (4Fe-4S)-binding protein [Lutimonas sp.]
MDQKKIVKRYKKDDLTIVWEPAKCIHSAVCVKMLPEVYDPNANPWIQPENGSVQQLKSQIEKCPSGALTYELEGSVSATGQDGLEVEIMENGPILIKGKLNITHPSGAVESKDKTTAFCRCGASASKPYCDGAHRKIDFQG